MKVLIRDCKSDKLLLTCEKIEESLNIWTLKENICKECKKLSIARQSIRSDPRGKSLGDDIQISTLAAPESKSLTLYVKDLGPQIGWRTVFLVEYTGPLFIYLAFWLIRQPFLGLGITPMHSAINLRNVALGCWVGHFIKRLLETVFIHRFSHATMPLKNLFINCGYYFGFAAFVAFYTNHPLYTPPMFGHKQIAFGFILFLIGEYGNFSCHLTLKRLRPAGSKVVRIPYPMSGWFLTRLFNYVACPHYTYEVTSWIGFSIMTQSLPAVLFTLFGLRQMSIWALGRLRSYRRDFPKEFPKQRKAIIPFIL